MVQSLLASLLAALSLVSSPVAGDALQGTWRANLSASRFVAGFPALRSQTLQCAAAQHGAIACTASRVPVTGKASAAHFTARYDGRRYPVTGLAEMDNVWLRRSGRALIAVFSKGTHPVYGYRIEPSADRLHLTIHSIDPRTFRTVYSIVRYDRVR